LFCSFIYDNVGDAKLLVVLQSVVVKVISNLQADKVSTDGVPFLISASVELAEMLVRLSLCPFTVKHSLQLYVVSSSKVMGYIVTLC
jgi:hypothetical protein